MTPPEQPQPLTPNELAICDDLIELGPTLRNLGHAHVSLDANARVLIARKVAARLAHETARADAAKERARVNFDQAALWRTEWEQITKTAEDLQTVGRVQSDALAHETARADRAERVVEAAKVFVQYCESDEWTIEGENIQINGLIAALDALTPADQPISGEAKS